MRFLENFFIKRIIKNMTGLNFSQIVEFLISRTINCKTLGIDYLTDYYSKLTPSQKIIADNVLRIVIAALIKRFVKIDYDDVVIKVVRGNE